MNRLFASPLTWAIVLLMFLTFFYYDRDFGEVKTKYVKQRMRLTRVHFSELDGPFESVRVFADHVDMDDNQSNMLASGVKAIFYDRDIATRTSLLVSLNAVKNPFESRFWGNVRLRSTDLEKLDCNELRYFPSRKEIFTQDPVRMVRGNAIITGVELRMNTETKTGTLDRNIRIEVYPASMTATAPVAATRLPTWATPQHQLDRLATATVASGTPLTASDTLVASPGVVASLPRGATATARLASSSPALASATAPASSVVAVRPASTTPGLASTTGTVRPASLASGSTVPRPSGPPDRWAGIRVFPPLQPQLDRPRHRAPASGTSPASGTARPSGGTPHGR